MKITTNNVPRDLIYGYDLTDKERAELDYYAWPIDSDGTPVEVLTSDVPIGWFKEFFRYKGQVYDLHEFEAINHYQNNMPTLTELKGWHAYQSDSFFSGMVIRYPVSDTSRHTLGPTYDVEYDYERVIVGTYYA